MPELSIDEKFGLILQSIGRIETDISEIKKVQLNQDELLKRQSEIIELLSARSISQESDLMRLKRMGTISKKDIS